MSQPSLDAAIAVTRFGLGSRPGEISEVARDPRGWLKSQIRPQGADTFATDGEDVSQRLAEFRAYRQQQQIDRQGGETPSDPAQAARRLIRDNAVADVATRIQLAIDTPAGFRERWALFWANHFSVSGQKVQVSSLVGPYENEAIRPHVFGRFNDLLVAAETHPAMLYYLDQAQSVGPNSAAAARRARSGRQGAGLNENLAREILELHTLGVDGGYTQADVTEFARALTGITVTGAEAAGAEPVIFRPGAHEPGARTVMGRRYGARGEEQARAILADLATAPQTARFVCSKLARHFVADTPPPGLAARLERAWIASDGDLSRVAEALIDAPEAWTPQPAKLKTPYEFVVSSYRALGSPRRGLQPLNAALAGLGQRTFNAPSPKGWPDEAGPWAAADAMVKRMQFAQGLAAMTAPGIDAPAARARDVLGARLGETADKAIARAESRTEALALLLMVPEFQRR